MKLFTISLSLGNQITVAVGFLPALLALFVAWWLPGYLTAASQESYDARATASVHLLARSLQPALDFDDAEFLGASLQALEADPEATGALLLRADGTVLSRWQRVQGDAMQPRAGWNGLVLTVHNDVVSPHQTADLYVRYRADVLGNLNQQAVITTTTTALVVFIGSLLLSLLLGRLLTRRLKNLGQASDAIGAGRFSDANRLLSDDSALGQDRLCRDEVLHLAAGMHTMSKSLEQNDRTIRNHNQTLQEQIHQQTNDLRQALTSAHQASEAKSTFLATVSHELRTPMNGVLGAAQLLVDGTLRPDQTELVQMMVRSSEALLALLDQVLDVSKIESGHVTLELTDFYLGDVLGDCVNLFRGSAQAKGIRLAMHVEDGPWLHVNGDSHRIRQIVSNLIGNAVKFTSTGGVTVQCTNHGPADTEGNAVLIEVQDTGTGISQQAQLKIFDAFTQADSSTTRRFGGTGLGLTICKKLVTLMGGEIGVRSTLGKGSTMWFRIPLVPVEHTESEVVADETPTFVPLRVLVVEDNMVNLTVVRRMLERLGHDVTMALNGVQALDAVNEQPFDVVLMDCHMPEMDGYEATRQIRSLPGRERNTPIVALTANAFEEDRQRCLACGMDDFLSKPLRMSALAETLERTHTMWHTRRRKSA